MFYKNLFVACDKISFVKYEELSINDWKTKKISFNYLVVIIVPIALGSTVINLI